MEKYYSIVTFAQELESSIEESIAVLRNSVRMAYYSGHISWETQYYSAQDKLVQQAPKWDNLMGLESKLYSYFLGCKAKLKAMDEEVLEAIRRGERIRASKILGSLDREKLIVKLERSYDALKGIRLWVQLQESKTPRAGVEGKVDLPGA
jgi:hypothetical protein